MVKPGYYRPGFILGVPSPGHEASKRPPRGRVCGAFGCETILSSYNKATSCWLHADPPRVRP